MSKEHILERAITINPGDLVHKTKHINSIATAWLAVIDVLITVDSQGWTYSHE